MNNDESNANRAALRARHEALVQIVSALARSEVPLDLASVVRDVHRAFEPAVRPEPAPIGAPKIRGKRAKGFGKGFKPFVPAAPAPPRSAGGEWPPTCPALPQDIEHSKGDGRLLRCFETGRWVRDLEPILRARKMTPAQYRTKWGLPRNYPMQSEAERVARSQLMPWLGRKPNAAEIAASIGQRTLISFEDGGHYKTLTTHLAARGLTPESYREKWGLPADYPMQAKATVAGMVARGRAVGAKNLKPRTKDDPRFKKAAR